MLQATELRLGNIFECNIWYPGNKEIITISSISERFITCKGKEGTFGLSSIKPIPLTEDILLKCGFKLFVWGWVSGISEERRTVRITIHKYFEREGQKPLKIKFLHELQNLYWCLVGEELEVNL